MNENRFYVYVHKIKETGEVFYVGKGTRGRLRSKESRSKLWKEITTNSDWFFEKYKENLTETEALSIESELINKLNPAANIVKNLKSRIEINTCYVSEMYKYDENSPSGLTHIMENCSYGKSKRNVGDQAGTLRKDNGYYIVINEKNGRSIYAHRVVWFLCKNEDPGKFVIDHIDGNPSNNKIDNLRKVTASENSRNLKRRSDNKTGFSGVKFCKTGRYVASWVSSEGKHIRMSFSVKVHGESVALALACLCRKVNTEDYHYDGNRNGVFDFSPLDTFSDSDLENLVRYNKLPVNIQT